MLLTDCGFGDQVGRNLNIFQLVEEGCVGKKTQQELLTTKQPTLDRVLGIMRMKTAQNETTHKGSKQTGIKGGFMEAVNVKRSVGGMVESSESERIQALATDAVEWVIGS